jgi:hypothetical protein
MRIGELFEKRVDRAIDPVVKAGSTEQLANELDEYVITPELRIHLNNFLDEYNERNATGNGAWIFGFFGSGKSHLLKILAVLLEDRVVEGKKASEYLLPKVSNDAMLDNSIRAALANHPSMSLLFNIDSKAPSREVPGTASLLIAFIKVFFEHCGYYSEDAIHIGAIERDLDRSGLLESFKAKVAQTTGKDWEIVRKAAAMYAPDITRTFDEVNGHAEGTTSNIVTYYQNSFSPSIEEFAGWVADYLKEKPKGFRLNFYVDEIGQYIAKNDKHMINLQTIAEELNTKCDGQSWVIVTSQENVEDIIGEMTKRSANDFSKIQARFKVKLPLTSKDAQAIIKQRLLSKNDAALASMGALYDRTNADFGVLFDFTDGAKNYNPFRNLEDFIDTYPFVPYQFDLFTTSLRGLSDHNALTGGYHAVGARSMLGVFQAVAKELAIDGDTETGNLASFDQIFDGLRTSLKTEEYTAIQQAEGQNFGSLETSTLARRTLKALFMVKYCEDFRGTIRNLRVLLYGGFYEDANKLEQNIQAVLDDLERQVYIRRNGNIYEYLTSEEKDIENEIKNTNTSSIDVKKQIGKFFTEGIVAMKKFSFDQGHFSTSFAYDVRVDGEDVSTQRNELKLNLLTSLSTEGIEESQLFSEIIGSNPKELAVVLQDDKGFVDEVRSFIKTDRYIRVNGGGNETSRERIISEKHQANLQREQQLIKKLDELVTSARFSAAGVEITDKVSGSGAEAVKAAGKLLVSRAYPKLQQLTTNFTDPAITSMTLATPLPGEIPPEFSTEVLTMVSQFEQRGYSVMVGGDSDGSLTAYFAKGQYGWPDIAVRMAIATLYAHNQIEVSKADKSLPAVELANALGKSKDLNQLKVKKTAVISAEELTALSNAYNIITGTNPSSNDAKATAEDLRGQLDKLYAGFNAPDNYLSEFPFKDAYKSNLAVLHQATNKGGWEWYAREFSAQAPTVKAAIDDLTKAKRFMDGTLSAGKLWREIGEFLKNESADIEAVDPSATKTTEIQAVINDPDCYKSSKMPEANALKDELKASIAAELAALKQQEQENLQAFQQTIATQHKYDEQEQEAKDAFDGLFTVANSQLSGIARIATARGFADRFKSGNLSRIAQIFTPKDADTPPEPAKKTKSWKEVFPLGYSKATVEDATQVSEFVEAYRQALQSSIDAGYIVLP